MAHRTYGGLGDKAAAVKAFTDLKPWAALLLDLQWQCEPFQADYLALGIALDGLETAAFHFTRHRDFYCDLRQQMPPLLKGRPKVLTRADAVAGLIELDGYQAALRRLLLRCRPMGADYNAITIALNCLETAAHHFPGDDAFYAPRVDSAGPSRPARATPQDFEGA